MTETKSGSRRMNRPNKSPIPQDSKSPSVVVSSVSSEQFQPTLGFGWIGRGENASKQRREELRRVAMTRIATIEQQARVQIDRNALQAKTEIIANGLASDAAQQFLNDLQPLERLMPPLELGDVETMLPQSRPTGYLPIE